MSEIRNHYGIPVTWPVDTIDPATPPRPRVLPRQASLAAPCDCMDELADELEEGDTWRDELSAAERDTYDLIQQQVARATSGSADPDIAYWLTEEVLYQIQHLIKQGRYLTLPGLGLLHLDADRALHAVNLEAKS